MKFKKTTGSSPETITFFLFHLLQETHLPDVTQGKLSGGDAFWSLGTKQSAGAGTLLQPGNVVEVIDHNRHRRLGSRSSRSFKSQVFTRRTNNPKRDILLLDPVGKWVGSDTSGENGITHLHAFADSLSLKDVYRVKNPSELLFTWFTGPHSVACHLDRFIPRARGDYKCVTIHISSVCKNTIGAFKSPGARRLEIVITTASLPQTLGSASGPLSKGNFETLNHGLIRTMPIIVTGYSRSKINYETMQRLRAVYSVRNSGLSC